MGGKTYRGNVLVEVIIVVAILAIVNLISLNYFARADLTQNRLYSISQSTKEVLRDLDDVINIKVYFSKKLPPYLTTLTRQVRDILDEYRAYAGHNLVIDFEDPTDDPELQRRVHSLGIPPVQLNIVEKDKAEVMNAYLGIAVLFEDRSEVIPVVQNANNLEYDLTSAIVKVASGERRIVGFLTGHDEPDIDKEYEVIRRSLEKQYEVKRVNTSKGKLVPDDVNTLIVASPRELSDWDLFAIDQFIMRGGRALFMVNRVEIPEGSLYAVHAKGVLDSLLSAYGVIIKPDLVIDRSAASATFTAGFFTYTLPYPLWPSIRKEGFSQESPITNQLERVVMPWASSIQLIDREEGKPESIVLVKSSPQSWSDERGLDLNPQRDFTPKSEVASRSLAVLLKGKFKSYFADRDVPEPEGGVAWEGTKIDSSPETEMIVIGNSRFVEDGFLRQFPENRTFFLNSVDWLTLGDRLIGIRSRAITSRPLKEIGESSKVAIRFGSTFGVPIAFIVWGLVRLQVRSRRRKDRLTFLEG